MIFESIALSIYNYQKIEGYESNYVRKTVRSKVQWIEIAGFSYHSFVFPKMSLSLAVGGEVCSLSLHRSGQGYISLHSLF
jgi:hypothetical protein